MQRFTTTENLDHVEIANEFSRLPGRIKKVEKIYVMKKYISEYVFSGQLQDSANNTCLGHACDLLQFETVLQWADNWMLWVFIFQLELSCNVDEVSVIYKLLFLHVCESF